MDRMLSRKNVVFATTHVIAAVLAIASLSLFLAVVFVPKVILHSDTYIVESTSMQPYLNPGDIIISDPGYKANELREGDVVTYLAPNLYDPFGSTMIVHRIVELDHNSDNTSYRFVTKGDNNKNPDIPITQLDVTGRVLYSIPMVGGVIDSPYSHLILGLLALLLLIVIVNHIRLRRRFKHDYVRS